MLTRWGCEIAEKNGVPTYLQSSPAGYQAYRKCGFKGVYATDVDLEDFGLDCIYRNWLMVRYPPARPGEIHND